MADWYGYAVRKSRLVPPDQVFRVGDEVLVHPDTYARLFNQPEEVKVSKLSEIVRKVRVVLTAAPAYLVGAAVVVSAVSEEIGEAFPGVDGTVTAIAGPVLAAIAAAIAIVRRVSPVAKVDRGL